MVCYVCHSEGRRTEAVAVCMGCGVALCPDHLVREKLAVWKDKQTGMATMRTKLPSPLPRTVCAECHRALNQT